MNQLTSWNSGLPAHSLLDTSAKDGEVGHVGDCRGTILTDGIDLLLTLALPLRVVYHGDQEVVNGTSDREDTDKSHHT